LISKNGGQMTSRSGPLGARRKAYARSWRRMQRILYPDVYQDPFIHVGHVPDAGIGGPVAWNREGKTFGETMPLINTVNQHLGSVTSETPWETTYHEVRFM
jgi:hypothetical protein